MVKEKPKPAKVPKLAKKSFAVIVYAVIVWMLAAPDQYQQNISKTRRICFFLIQPPSAFSLAHPSNDTSGINAPPKIPARSKTPLRTVQKHTPEKNPDASSTGVPRKQKGGGGGNTTPHDETRVESAGDAAKASSSTTASTAKEGKKSDAPESADVALPSVKTVPPSPKVYIRKVKGKARKDQK